jgi:hypothetical protein
MQEKDLYTGPSWFSTCSLGLLASSRDLKSQEGPVFRPFSYTYILLPMFPTVDSPHYNVPHGWFASQVEVVEPQVEPAEDHYPT